jgi:hypothetical protein
MVVVVTAHVDVLHMVSKTSVAGTFCGWYVLWMGRFVNRTFCGWGYVGGWYIWPWDVHS